MQKEIFIPNINLSKPIGNKGKRVAIVILAFIFGLGLFIITISNENSSFKIISSKPASAPFLESMQGNVLSSQSQSEETLYNESSVKTASSSFLVNKTTSSTPSPILTPTLTPPPTVSPTLIPTITSAITPTPETNDVIRQYDGPPLAPSQEKKDLLVLDFDSEVKGWTEDKTKNVEKKEGKKNQAISIKNNTFMLQNGEVFINAGTLSFWLKFETVDYSRGEVPILNWNFDGSDKYQPWLFEISYANAHDQLSFSIYDEDNQQYDVSAEFKNPRDWHYITLTWELTKKPYKRVLYIDSKKAAEDIFPFVPSTKASSAFKIGGNLGNRISGEFLIDELILTNFAKSGEEISTL